MTTMWKFRVPVQHKPMDLWVPAWANIRHVQCEDDNSVTFWAEVLPNNEAVLRRFKVFGTGHEVTNRWHYVGTGHAPYKRLVWHLFEDLVFVPLEEEEEE